MPDQDETTTTETVSEETTSEETAQGAESEDADPAGSEALGDAGKRALDSMKTKWREERDKRRDLESRLAALEDSAKSGDTETPDAIKAQATREAMTKANARIVRSEIKATAAGMLADPADALAFLDPAKFEVDENGDVDADEIKDAIEELLTRKPHLAATARPRFQGSGDGGATRKASAPAQLTSDDLKKMTPHQIVKAKAEGRLNTILGL